MKKISIEKMPKEKPYILAPAGDRDSFLAALAAGADAIYCGLKIFSARMEAENFGVSELTRLTQFAKSKGVEVYIAFNSMIKQNEIGKVFKILKKITKYIKPHALIVQDLAMIPIAQEAGFKGELHLSTLGNSSFAAGLDSVKNCGFSRIVLPRELNIDEIKAMAEKTPDNIELEIFVHGALCYGVSGRCYWSSWFGGKSGLRGRCVQPCRRLYSQNGNAQKFFSCLDLSMDVLVKVLKDIPQITCWKIEGRKKSAHYVFYTTKAYKMLRDSGNEPEKKKTALAFLQYALGRPATHYNFLPQRPQNPLKKNIETGSGLFVGRVKAGSNPYVITREPLFTNDLLRIGYEDDKRHTIQRVTRSVPKKGKFVLKDINKKIQIGKNSRNTYENGTYGKKKYGKKEIKKDKYNLNYKKNFKKGTPVFIVDRREEDIALLIKNMAVELEEIQAPELVTVHHELELNLKKLELVSSEKKEKRKPQAKSSAKTIDISLFRKFSDLKNSYSFHQNSSRAYDNYQGKQKSVKKPNHTWKSTGKNQALWISNENIKKVSGKLIKDLWWWLPPVIWPLNDEKKYANAVERILSKGGRNFVLNIPWQISFFTNKLKGNSQFKGNAKFKVNSDSGRKFNKITKFDKNLKIKKLNIWAGPFCNIANTACLQTLKNMGFSGAIVSPELDEKNFLSLPDSSPLPLGAVIYGNWPVSISRIISDDIKTDMFFSSPMRENCWVSKKDGNYWVFPGWQLDLSEKKEEMQRAGYNTFIHINESIPKKIIMKKRQGLWNWNLNLL